MEGERENGGKGMVEEWKGRYSLMSDFSGILSVSDYLCSL